MSLTLFLDTTSNAHIGLLKDGEFIGFEKGSEQKASQKFHYRVYELLEKNKLKLAEIKHIFQMAGPGSYTGMRLSEGFANILEINDTRVNSLYHFEIPSLLGEMDYTFISNAFKKEYFIADYTDGQLTKSLVAHKEFQSHKKLYSHEAFEDIEASSTLELIIQNPQLIETAIQNDTKRELYYYRALDDEFKVKAAQS